MGAGLSSEHYLSTDVFERERERLFGRLWIFAGIKSMVGRPDSYIARQLAGTPVVIQNFAGELCAFENLCAHRQNLVQRPGFGVRPLVCGYHGWRYDRSGQASFIPLHDEYYRFDPTQRSTIGLRRFQLHEVGNLIFVNLSLRPLPFSDQFNESVVADLTEVSAAFDDEVLVAEWETAHNWKLAYENLRDGLHPRFVHTRTLATEVDFVPPPLTGREADHKPTLQSLSYGGAEGEFRASRRFGFHQHVQRWGSRDAYFNWLLYPNTHVLTSDGGYSFSIEHHDPVAPGRTALTVYFMTAKRKRSWQGSAAALWAYARGAKIILDEDIAIMEAIQRGLHREAPSAAHGAYEHDNRRVQAWYLRAMSPEQRGNL